MRTNPKTKVLLPLAIITIAFIAYAAINMQHTSEMTLPLHTEGKLIKNAAGDIVVLRGVWVGMFADTSTGYFGLDVNKWDEAALRETCTRLRDVWGVNCINTFIWGDWWLENKRDNLGEKGVTDIGLRDAIVRTTQITAEYGIYFQVRLYGINRTIGRTEGNPFAPSVPWTEQDFADFWVNVATTLKGYDNVILALYDEPLGDQATYLRVAYQTITAMRNAGFDGIIVIHYGYCGDMLWVGDWVNSGYSTQNIVFSEHIYRSGGTFQWTDESPVTLDHVRNFMNNSLGEPQGTATNYILNTYNVPIWVSAIGAEYGATDDDEYIAFANTLQVLNEFQIGYCVFSATRSALQWTCLENPTGEIFSAPNRIGEALIDAIDTAESRSVIH
jgi:hypothetical protein